MMSVNHHEMTLNQLISMIPVRKKLIDQDDREKFEWNQWQSATKTMNNVEIPIKEKHIQNLILGTNRLEGSRLFWSMIVRIHVQSHPIICWKFCYVIHRMLKDGHRYVITDTILLLPYFQQLCKYWSGALQNYGLLTYRYCYLIVMKLKFHERNIQFKGNLTLIDDKTNIENLFYENWNSYIQLCIELFDYFEELLNLVHVIFNSLDQSRTNSMTTIGQCYLIPLIILIQDSSLLYDYIVRILFKVHQVLSNETLENHRQKFIEQFQRLKRFYSQSSMLQYFKNLIKLPILPENPPNFINKEDLKNYRTAIAILNSSEITNNFLIDQLNTNKSIISTIVNNDLSVNRSKEISELEQRLMQYDTMLKQNRSETDDLHRTIATKDAELLNERNYRLQIEEQLRQQFQNQKRLEDMQIIEKQTNSDEKFNQLRQEHLTMLRQESERQKELAVLNHEILELKEEQKNKETEFLKISNKFHEEILQLHQTNDELQERIQILTNERNDYQTITEKNHERIKEIEYAKQNVEQRFKELDKDKIIIEKQLKQTEGVRRNLFEKNLEHQEDLLDLIHEKELLEEKILHLEQTIRQWAQKFIEATDKQKLIQINYENLLQQEYKYSILSYCIQQMYDGLERKKCITSSNRMEKLEIALFSMMKIQELWRKQKDSDGVMIVSFLMECITLTNCLSTVADDYHELTNHCIDLFKNFQISLSSNNIEEKMNSFIDQLNLSKKKTQT